jgi:hypothetical protein
MAKEACSKILEIQRKTLKEKNNGVLEDEWKYNAYITTRRNN